MKKVLLLTVDYVSVLVLLESAFCNVTDYAFVCCAAGKAKYELGTQLLSQFFKPKVY